MSNPKVSGMLVRPLKSVRNNIGYIEDIAGKRLEM